MYLWPIKADGASGAGDPPNSVPLPSNRNLNRGTQRSFEMSGWHPSPIVLRSCQWWPEHAAEMFAAACQRGRGGGHGRPRKTLGAQTHQEEEDEETLKHRGALQKP